MDASSAHQDSLPLSSDALLAQMRDAGVDFELYQHIPLRTVEDAKTVQGVDVPAGPARLNIKNFYLRDRKKRNYLVVLEQDRAVDLKALGAASGAGNVSFGSDDRLMEFLGIRPGAVSPLAMVNGGPKGACSSGWTERCRRRHSSMCIPWSMIAPSRCRRMFWSSC